MKLRLKELRELESLLINYFSVYPFNEGYYLFGGEIDTSQYKINLKDIDNIRLKRLSKINGIICYNIIGSAFIIAYIIIGWFAVK